MAIMHIYFIEKLFSPIADRDIYGVHADGGWSQMPPESDLKTLNPQHRYTLSKPVDDCSCAGLECKTDKPPYIGASLQDLSSIASKIIPELDAKTWNLGFNGFFYELGPIRTEDENVKREISIQPAVLKTKLRNWRTRVQY